MNDRALHVLGPSRPLLSLLLAISLVWAASASAEVTYKIPLSLSLIGREAGPDLMIGTADDVPGDNVFGAAGYIEWLDKNGDRVGIGTGTSEFTYLDTNDPIPLGVSTSFEQFNTGPLPSLGFFSIGIDDPKENPHRVEVFSNHTYDIEYTFRSCASSDQDCSDPVVETDLVADGVWWEDGDDLDSIPAIKSHPILGDLTDYAAFAESISPVDASSFAITVISMPITSNNVGGTFFQPSWIGGTVVGVQAYFFQAPVAGGPPVVFDFEDQPRDTSANGSLGSLEMTKSGISIEITRFAGARFDVITHSDYPGNWDDRALSSGVDQSVHAYLATFSEPVTSVSIEAGDFGVDDSDTVFLHAFSGEDATGEFLATDSGYWGDAAFDGSSGDPAIVLKVSSRQGVRSVIFNGGTTSFPHSVFYDNITVPEPAGLGFVAMLVLAGLRGVRRRTAGSVAAIGCL